MARSRNIKPSFFLDDELAELEPLTRILFCGLWCVADRAGRLRDRPKRIKAQVLPYDDFNVDSALNALDSTGFIQRYEANKKTYIQILNFDKHQNPHCKEQESTIPAPCKHGTSTADSLNLIPDSLKHTHDAKFDEWWGVYDKKVDRKRCEAKWKRMDWKRLGITPDDLIADAKNRHMNCGKWLAGYQSNPLTYLNGEKWNDEISKRNRNGTGNQTVQTPLDRHHEAVRRAGQAIDGEIVGTDDDSVR